MSSIDDTRYALQGAAGYLDQARAAAGRDPQLAAALIGSIMLAIAAARDAREQLAAFEANGDE